MFPGNISGNEKLTLSNEINLMISLDKEMNIKIYQKLCAESKILWTQLVYKECKKEILVG